MNAGWTRVALVVIGLMASVLLVNEVVRARRVENRAKQLLTAVP